MAGVATELGTTAVELHVEVTEQPTAVRVVVTVTEVWVRVDDTVVLLTTVVVAVIVLVVTLGCEDSGVA